MNRALLIAVMLTCFGATSARAGYLIGPTPYLSQADSPFDLSGLGTKMFLEDFEQGAATTPGIPAKHNVFIQPPGPLTDSVDADDGTIDGSGNAGYSIRSLATQIEPTNPPRIYHYLPIDIDTDALGFIPNLFGFVITDGPPLASLEIMLLDDDRQFIKSYSWGERFREPMLDDSFDGSTAEDKFFGIYETEGIRYAQVILLTRDVNVDSFEMDHVQYGLAAPEPASWVLAIVSVALAAWVHFAKSLEK